MQRPLLMWSLACSCQLLGGLLLAIAYVIIGLFKIASYDVYL